ncbi:MAG: DUF4838 domain-containing protein [Bryobacterales bacterium]|nr:DUF4838 domain-containing protein [Bryobacterales bacterium]
MLRRQFLATPLVLAQSRSTPYTICLSGEASPSERRAAAEIQTHVEQMCGARLPVVMEDAHPQGPLILVGRQPALERLGFEIPFETLGREGFCVQTKGEHVAIAGGRQRGTMYGAYEFLERLGCRWYANDLTVVPKRATLQIPALDIVQRPGFEYREVLINEASTKDFAARSRLNGHFTELDASTGGKVLFEPFVHSFYALAPPAKYFGSHPEYYALVNGERRQERAQLCLTNPDVARIAIESALEWIRTKPEAEIISVSTNDADGACECENCRRATAEEGAHSGLLLRFVNTVAEAVGKKHPDKLIETIAYRHTEAPPNKARPVANVRVRLALSGPCQAHPYELCPHDKYAVDFLKAWGRVTDKLYIWHYMTQFHQALEPYPNLDELTADLSMYQRNNVVGLFLQGSYSKGGGSHLADLRSYLLAKLLWNPQQPAQPIVTEFLRAYYGPGARHMQEYLDLIHREVRFPPRGLGKTIYMYAGPKWERDFVDKARAIVGRAEAANAGTGDAMHRRIRKVKLSTDSVELFEAMRLVLHKDRLGPVDLDGFWRKWDRFSKEATALGITEWHEGVPRETSEQEYRKIIRNYDLTILQNAHLRVVVAPEFAGRVVSIGNLKTGGKNALRMMEPDERLTGAEALGGLTLLLHNEHYSRTFYTPEWRVQSNDGVGRMVMEGICSNGLQVERVLELSAAEPLLTVKATVRNGGARPVPLAIQSRFEINPGDREHPTVDLVFRRRGGSREVTPILPARGQNYGDDFFFADERPDGEWGLINPSVGIQLVNRIRDDQVERCRFWWRGRSRNTVALGAWSAKRMLASGETMTFETSYLAGREPGGTV